MTDAERVKSMETSLWYSREGWATGRREYQVNYGLPRSQQVWPSTPPHIPAAYALAYERGWWCGYQAAEQELEQFGIKQEETL